MRKTQKKMNKKTNEEKSTLILAMDVIITYVPPSGFYIFVSFIFSLFVRLRVREDSISVLVL